MAVPENKYNLSLRILHWVSAALFIGIFISGYFMVGLDGKVDPYKYDIYAFHKSFGVLALGLVISRLIVRLSNKAPAYTTALPPITLALAKITHLSLYIVMIIVPLSGFLMSMLGEKGIVFFGWKLPMFLPTDKDFSGLFWQIHVKAPYIAGIFVLLHIAAAAKHYIIDKDDVWQRMSFGRKSAVIDKIDEQNIIL